MNRIFCNKRKCISSNYKSIRTRLLKNDIYNNYAPEIKNIGRMAYSVRAPQDLTTESALQLLKDEFPGIILDTSFQRER